MNLVYNASAGTGKTYQVTQLYEKLVLEEGIDPRRILLMTFTDNAAAELRMRVSHRLLKARRTAEAEAHGERAEQAIRAMARLPSAPIGTIHSFCTRLLREHALEAGLSPGFSTLVGDDRDELLSQICHEELLSRLTTDPDFKAFCSGTHIIGNGGFGTSITETVPHLISQAGSLGIDLENAEALLPEPQPAGSLSAFSIILSRLNELPKLTADAKKVAQCLEDNIPTSENAEELATVLLRSGLKKFGRGKGQKPISDDFWELLTSVVDAIKYKERFPAAKAFARYVQAVVQQFQQRKHAMDSVDFDDQLRMAAELLKSGTAAPEFDYVIVDEVQDTSRIQCDLIESLWVGTDRRDVRQSEESGGLGEAALPKDTNLVICGDKKQSIYTWRGADPQVMPDLEQAILSGGGQRENLQTSYRSKAPILDVVNKLFESVYGEEKYSSGDRLEPNPTFSVADEKPCIEFLAPDDDIEEWSKQEKVAAEMEAVANRIQLLVTGSSDWHPGYRYADGFKKTAPTNAYCYSDILILLRRTTHQSVLEQALRHAGIPYTLGGKGRGLFTRQETRDVSLFLNVITNPADAYSLVGFLRSPWIGLSDETIAELAWSADGFSADNLRDNFAEEGVDHSRSMGILPMNHGQGARATILRYRELLGTKLASELVRMLIDETGFDAILAGLPRGTQRLANLRKVLDWLRENERGAHTTPAAVARKLADKIDNPPQIPEAALLDPAQNAVTVMTVHGSKGLTKRVVCLPDISSRPDTDRGFSRVFFDETHQPTLGVKITAPDKSSVASPGFTAANTKARNVRDHELKNLFYVAMTRARDLVVTSATVGKNPAGWLKWLEPMINTDLPAIPYSTLSASATTPQTATRKLQTTDQLEAVLQTLAPPPERPQLQRIPATRLAKKAKSETTVSRTGTAVKDATELGSLGHAVLEQLALNGWGGSVGDWLDILCDDFGIGSPEASALAGRIEQTRELMRGLTADMEAIHPELPFLLHDGDSLIDGTIDLLCRTDGKTLLYDYKFTESDDAMVSADYREQMAIYGKAALKAFPADETPAIWMVVVSAAGVRLLPMRI